MTSTGPSSGNGSQITRSLVNACMRQQELHSIDCRTKPRRLVALKQQTARWLYITCRQRAAAKPTRRGLGVGEHGRGETEETAAHIPGLRSMPSAEHTMQAEHREPNAAARRHQRARTSFSRQMSAFLCGAAIKSKSAGHSPATPRRRGVGEGKLAVC